MKRKILAVCFFASANLAFAAPDQSTVKWGYSGDISPEHWATLDPSFAICANGTSQSPIDIAEGILSDKSQLKIDYTPGPLIIEKDGTTSLTLGNQNLVINDGHTVQLNFPDSRAKESIQFAGDTYKLVQLHFHTPAENHLNGVVFPAEIHFVNQGANGKLAVIGVFIRSGHDNPILQRILNNLPALSGQPQEIKDAGINPAELLPKNYSYDTFVGSLTTPPCAEGVRWIVMTNPIEASAGQIMKLRRSISEDNARPVQPLNRRTIIHVDVSATSDTSMSNDTKTNPQ